MRCHQIADVNVIANAGAVRRIIVATEHLKFVALAERGLARHLDQVCGLGCRLAGAPFGVGPGHIEVAQGNVVEVVIGRRAVAQHPFCHQLGRTIRRDRRQIDAFIDGIGIRDAINGGG